MGSQNTANGQSALNKNTIGMQDTALGGTANVGVGNNTLFNSTTGSGNTALGSGAGSALTTASKGKLVAVRLCS
jgi:hypothetical protein